MVIHYKQGLQEEKSKKRKVHFQAFLERLHLCFLGKCKYQLVLQHDDFFFHWNSFNLFFECTDIYLPIVASFKKISNPLFGRSMITDSSIG